MSQSISQIFESQKNNRWKIAISTAQERIARLEKLRTVIKKYIPELETAFYTDYKKPSLEVQLTEIFPTLEEINFAISHLKKWMQPKKVNTPITLFGAKTELYYEAKGQVLIMSPWNYPFNLLICPLVAAIAAGNVAILRPSNKVPQVSEVTAKIIAEAFPPNEVALFLGDSKVADELLELPFDHILFTGSTRIGKKIMESAAKHLSSVTLELGGKSPVIVTDDADLELVVRRLVWGKYLNGGQTCIAPDYVYAPKHLISILEQKIKERIQENFPAVAEGHPDLTHIVDQSGIERLQGLVDKSIQQGATLVLGGNSKKESKYFSPTVLGQVEPHHEVMSQEIFGPILPILAYENLSEVILHIQKNPKPLALYIFSNNKKRTQKILKETTSGAAVVNHMIIQAANPYAPFGGIGASGQGSYHGHYGFKTFSHERTVMTQSKINMLRMFYPPYNSKLAQLGLRLTQLLIK